MDIAGSEKYILDLLGRELSDTLYYHGLHHTLDVENAALILAKEEAVDDAESLALLKTAALFHDSGFINTYKDHEEEGCTIVRSSLPLFQYTNEQIEIICGMIMATKIPQSPKTHLEKIICDADLDYLGRDDFELIAATLFKELFLRNLVADENTWNNIQVKFIGMHRYHTESAVKKRECKKQKHLHNLQLLIKP
ncbi:HD domain-containing protein [Dyadobacter sp. CY356]|uniref:HD domain-containing protein n=1 Tax=Dyadobacter sp. CY356 TaxID=2906442 RepID=UPI001F191A50|nr:HD domain-containing protein [Dyadobacter sp. CY356]MCF0055614.1 HD domain-containing protein [Dyadobacter sp. CY356]